MVARLIRFFGWCVFVCVGMLSFPRLALAYSSGATSDNWGYTGNAGCNNCHAGGTAPSLVSFSGPSGSLSTATGSLAATAGVSSTFTIVANVGAQSAGGINVTSTGGVLSTCSGGNCSALQLRTTSTFGPGALTAPYSPQITHTTPRAKDGSNRVTYSFNYTPPSNACSSQLIVWVNGVNLAAGSNGDKAAAFVYTIYANGAACNDGNACTQSDACLSGSCQGSNPVVCPTPSACHTAGACNPSNGTCSNPIAMDGTACNDGNACTQSDSCVAGTCTGNNPVICPSPALCHDPGACNPATGTCSNPVKMDGASCSDANPCTLTDTCSSGQCTGNNPVMCPPPDGCHEMGSCSMSSGMCVYVPKINGTSCDDGNPNTTDDVCQGGSCAGVDHCLGVVCPASDQCHAVGACIDHATGACSDPTQVDGTSCDDGDPLTGNDACATGVCVGNNLCLGVDCPAPDVCHVGVCNSGTGACETPANQIDNTPCDDGDACTQSDTCQAGVCTGASPVSCNAQDECHESGACDTTTGVCSNPLLTDGTSCSIGTCESGVCTGAAGTGGTSGTGGASGTAGTSGSSGTAGSSGGSGQAGAGGTGGTGGTAGSAGTGGTGGSSGQAGTSNPGGAAGTSTSGNAGSSGAATNGTAGTSGTAPAASPSSDDGGCSVRGAATSGNSPAIAALALLLGLGVARRRRAA